MNMSVFHPALFIVGVITSVFSLLMVSPVVLLTSGEHPDLSAPGPDHMTAGTFKPLPDAAKRMLSAGTLFARSNRWPWVLFSPPLSGKTDAVP
jgi:hypothetical protein